MKFTVTIDREHITIRQPRRSWRIPLTEIAITGCRDGHLLIVTRLGAWCRVPAIFAGTDRLVAGLILQIIANARAQPLNDLTDRSPASRSAR